MRADAVVGTASAATAAKATARRRTGRDSTSSAFSLIRAANRRLHLRLLADLGRLLLEELLEARRALERDESRGPFEPLLPQAS
jgi:hypothetical protein